MITDLLYMIANFFGEEILVFPFFGVLVFFITFLIGTFILLIPFLMIYALVRRWL